MKVNTLFKNIKIDMPISVVVFLVTVPLNLNIALASEIPLKRQLTLSIFI